MTLWGIVRPLLAAVAVVVSLAPLQAQDTAAKALIINGDVSVLRDGGPWALFEGNTVRPRQIVKSPTAASSKSSPTPNLYSAPIRRRGKTCWML
jgi:hypothetical protein